MYCFTTGKGTYFLLTAVHQSGLLLRFYSIPYTGSYIRGNL